MSRTRLVEWDKFGPALALFVAACVFLVWANTYAGREKEFPVLVAGWTVVLTFLDMVANTRTRIGAYLAGLFSGGVSPARKDTGFVVRGVRAEFVAMLWVSGFVLAVFVFGFLVVLPIYISLFMLLQGRRSIRQSLISAGATTLLIYLVFQLLWGYAIYPGLLFS